MATYKEIHGVKVQYRDSDATAITGDVWYNASTGILKMYSALGAWATGGDMTTPRDNFAGAGTQTAALVCGGRAQPGTPGDLGVTETYDGSSWTEVADITGGHNNACLGTQTAALTTGRANTAVTEEWNGASWTEVLDLNSGRGGGRGAGTTTAGLLMGGASPAVSGATEEWNGTSWTEEADLNEARGNAAGYGTQTAAHFVGGNTPPSTTVNTEIYDGTSWTEVNNINTAQYGLAGAGSTSAGIKFGGDITPSKSAVVEEFDGTSWTEVADLSTARGLLAGAMAGTSSSTLAAGGRTGPGTNKTDATEEWTAAASIQTVAFD